MEDDLLRVVVSKMYGVITIDADLQRFFKEHINSFMYSVAEDSSEHQLLWSEIYGNFEELMEEKLEDIAVSLGFSDSQQFFEALKLKLGVEGGGGGGGARGGETDKKAGGNGGQNRKEARMLNLLVASYDYEKFVSLMKIKARKVLVQRERSAGEEKGADTDTDGSDDGSASETKDGLDGGEGEGKDDEGDGPHEMFSNGNQDGDY